MQPSVTAHQHVSHACSSTSHIIEWMAHLQIHCYWHQLWEGNMLYNFDVSNMWYRVVGHEQGYKPIVAGINELTFQAPAQQAAMLLVH